MKGRKDETHGKVYSKISGRIKLFVNGRATTGARMDGLRHANMAGGNVFTAI